MKYRDRGFYSKQLSLVMAVLDARVALERASWSYPSQEHISGIYHSFSPQRVDLYLHSSHQKKLEAVTRHLARELGIEFSSHQFDHETKEMRMVGRINGVKIDIEGGFLDACQMVELPVTLPAQEALPERIEMKERLVCPDKPLVIGETGQWKVKEPAP